MGGWSEDDTHSTIPERFAQQVARRAEHPAIAGTSQPLTYAELDALAGRYGAAVAERTRDGGGVALLLGHDATVVAAALGALSCGRSVVTLNPGDPPLRLGQIWTVAQPQLLITDAAHASQATAAGFPESHTLLLAEAPDALPAPGSNPVGPDDLAFLISTSGSTGQPKLVTQPHRNVLHNVLRYTNGLGLGEDDRVAWLASLSGGQGLATVWSTLLNGATLCPFPIVERGVTGLADWLAEHQVTVFDTLASVLRNFSRTLGDRQLHGIRLLRLASEAALRGDYDAYRRHFPEGCALATVLASSEAGIIAQAILQVDDEPPEGRLPVGRPAEGIDVLLLDENGREVETGDTGEIVIQGNHLSPGYWGDETLTAERFASVHGVRRLRTGDLARRSDSGMITVVGRADGQVKIRGHRLQLEEVEAALSRQPDVAAAAAAVRSSRHGDVRLTAYVIPTQGQTLNIGRLRASLASALPAHAVPSAFVCVDSFPLNAHGKVDRGALATVAPPRPTSAPLDRAVSDTEALLLGMWATAFERDEIGLGVGFLELGGDSLTAAVIAADVHELFGVELSLREFALDPTVERLAALVDEHRGTVPQDEEPSLHRVPRRGPTPMSLHQEHLWTLAPTKAAGLNLALPFRIRGPLDVPALGHSLEYIMQRHEILRSTFEEQDGEPVQVIAPSARLELAIGDLRGEPDPEASAEAILAEDANTQFDVGDRPPLSLRLLRLADDEHRLQLVAHHLLCDAPSWKFFFDELAVLYEARLSGSPAPLPPELPLQFADYAIWERASTRPGTARFEREVAWWERAFAVPAPTLVLPFQRAQPSDSDHASPGVVDWGLPGEQAAALDRIGNQSGATRFMTWLAAFAALVAQETGVQDITLSTVTTTRRKAELQRMFGPLINRSLLRLQFSPQRTFRDWLADVRGAVLDTSAHCTVSYEELWEELGRRGVRRPTRRTTFLARYGVATMHFGGLELEPLRRHYVEPWMFSLGVETQHGTDQCRAVFDTRVYDPAGVAQFLGRLQELAAGVCAEPDRPLGEIQPSVRRITGRQEPNMPSVEDVASAVEGLGDISPGRGRLITRMVYDHSVRDALVLGIQRGTASCYIAAALQKRGRGQVVTIGRADQITASPSIDELLERLSISERATVLYEYDTYNWRLRCLLAQRPRPQFDLLFIGGPCWWDTDGLAFLLAEQMLAPGGYIMFANLHWTLADSPRLSAQTEGWPDELRTTQHAKLICDELVRPHPNIAEYWEDARWGFARKRDGVDRVDDATRTAALELIREQAAALRERAEQAWRSEQWESLASVHPLTGVRREPPRALGEAAGTGDGSR